MQALGNPNGKSQSGTLATALETPLSTEEPTAAQVDQDTANSSEEQESRYFRLWPEYTEGLSWLNDPRDLDLYGAFGEKIPNLENNYNIEGLRPILKERRGDEVWICEIRRVSTTYRTFWEGLLARITEERTQGPELNEVEDIMDNILENISWVEQDAVTVFLT